LVISAAWQRAADIIFTAVYAPGCGRGDVLTARRRRLTLDTLASRAGERFHVGPAHHL